MQKPNRVRPLSEIECMLDKWKLYNPIFSTHMAAFDKAFDRGSPLHPDEYVGREDETFTCEQRLLDLLFSKHMNPTGKVYVLHGPVGCGKTSLVRFLCEKHIPKKRPSTLGIYLNAYPFPEGANQVTPLFERRLLAAIESACSRPPLNCVDQADYFKKVLTFLGFKWKSDLELRQMGASLRLEEVIRFLLACSDLKSVMFVIDNIDEHTPDFLEELSRFALQIGGYCMEQSKVDWCVLITSREYNVNNFFDQERFAHKELAPMDESRIVKSKIRALRQCVRSGVVINPAYTLHGAKPSEPKIIQSQKVRLDADYLAQLIDRACEHLLSDREPDFLQLQRRLAAGNLRVLVGNVYNFFHSVKLNKVPLLELAWTPDTAIGKENVRGLIPEDKAIECLCAIHYPFFDVTASHITNIFNAFNSNAPNDYHNTLTIPRILLFLTKARMMNYVQLLHRLITFGYEKEYIEPAVDKCFHYGLITCTNGSSRRHLNCNSNIKITSAGEYYVQVAMLQVAYLQYACEDCWLDQKCIVPITEKYTVGKTHGRLERRMDSAIKLVEFIKTEELRERRAIKERKLDIKSYLSEFGILKGDKARWIYEEMFDTVVPSAERIKSAYETNSTN